MVSASTTTVAGSSRSCDLVIHAAAAVSFDAPLDQAVEVNLLGPSRVAATLLGARRLRTGGRAAPPPRLGVDRLREQRPPRRRARGARLEESVHLPSRLGRRGRRRPARPLDADAESRNRERLTRIRRRARTTSSGRPATRCSPSEPSASESSGSTTSSSSSGGPAPRRSVGRTPTRTRSRSARSALLEPAATLPVTDRPPSIVESALAEPVPGWIRGFRMAEPVIISYARGLLRQFPGVPEGVIDVIPVDLVVAAIIAVAAARPRAAGRRRRYQVASGVRNPLRYGTLVGLCEEWFTERPLYDKQGQPIVVPKWSFPGRGKVQGELRRAAKVLGVAERLVNTLPIRGELAERAAAIEERRSLAERALGYVELYGAYTETEARFRIDRTLDAVRFARRRRPARPSASTRSSSTGTDLRPRGPPPFGRRPRPRPHDARAPHRPEPRGARPRRRPHAPSPAARSSTSSRRSSTPTSSSPTRGSPRATSPRGERAQLARRAARRGAAAARDRPSRPRRLPPLLLPPVRRGARRPDPRGLLGAVQRPPARPASSPRRSPGSGHTAPSGTRRSSSPARSTSSSLRSRRCSMRSSAPASASVDGKFTGELVDDAADRRGAGDPDGAAGRVGFGLDLARTVAYADSTSDLPMLEAAGHAVAVNPEPKLAASPDDGDGRSRTGAGQGRPVQPLAIATRSLGPRMPGVPTRAGGPRPATGSVVVKALLIERSVPTGSPQRRRRR